MAQTNRLALIWPIGALWETFHSFNNWQHSGGNIMDSSSFSHILSAMKRCSLLWSNQNSLRLLSANTKYFAPKSCNVALMKPKQTAGRTPTRSVAETKFPGWALAWRQFSLAKQPRTKRLDQSEDHLSLEILEVNAENVHTMLTD